MHPGLAGVVLAASPSPSASPSAHGGIQWGDVPAWVAAIATVVGLTAAITGATIAYRQFRQQTEVLNRQLQELREREEDRAREQAESVMLGWHEKGRDPSCGVVENQSRRPITNIVAALVVGHPPEGPTTYPQDKWTTGGPKAEHKHKPWTETVGGELRLLSPGAVATAWFEHNRPPLGLADVAGQTLIVRFKDDAGRRWQPDEFQHLERAPEDGW